MAVEYDLGQVGNNFEIYEAYDFDTNGAITTNGTYQLTGDIRDYPFLIVVASYGGDMTTEMLPSLMLQDLNKRGQKVMICYGYANTGNYVAFEVFNDTLTVSEISRASIQKIYFLR